MNYGKRSWIWILGWALTLCWGVQAQEPQVSFIYSNNHRTHYLDPTEPFNRLENVSMLWVDSARRGTIEDAHFEGAEKRFMDWPKKTPSWHSPSNYWIRLSCFNPETTSQNWILHLGRADSASVWVLHEQGGTELTETGLFSELKAGDWISRTGEVSVPLEIPGRRAVTVYACLSSKHSGVRLTPYLQHNDVWVNQQVAESWLQQVMMALLLIVLAVNLPTVLWQRRVSHLYFMLFALLYGAWVLYAYGYLRMHLWAGNPLSNWYAGAFSLLFAQPLFLWFVHAQIHPPSPMMQVWVWVRLGLSGFLAIMVALEMPIPLDWAARSFWIFDALLLLHIGVMGKRPFLWKGRPSEKWILGGGFWLYACLLAGMLLDTCRDMQWTGFGYPTHIYAFQLGAAGVFLAYIWSTLRYAMQHKMALGGSAMQHEGV